jgi:hypothetical protein
MYTPPVNKENYVEDIVIAIVNCRDIVNVDVGHKILIDCHVALTDMEKEKEADTGETEEEKIKFSDTLEDDDKETIVKNRGCDSYENNRSLYAPSYAHSFLNSSKRLLSISTCLSLNRNALA